VLLLYAHTRPCCLRDIAKANVERACADAAIVHGAENLDVANGSRPKRLGILIFDGRW
jgi:hypothetical protein